MKTIISALAIASAAANQAVTTAARFNWHNIPGAAENMMIGIILKERAQLAKCRAGQKKGETACFKNVQKCANSAKCTTAHFKKHHAQCFKNKACAKGVMGCMRDRGCHKMIIGCVDGPRGCKAGKYNVESYLVRFRWNVLRRNTKQQIAHIISRERKQLRKCHKGNAVKRVTCYKGVKKCLMNEKCLEAHFKKNYPKCVANARCIDNVRLCFNDKNCRSDMEMCLQSNAFCNFKVQPMAAAPKAKAVAKKVKKAKKAIKAHAKKAVKKVVKAAKKAAVKKAIKAKKSVKKAVKKATKKAVKKAVKAAKK